MNEPVVNGQEPPIGFYVLLGSYFGDWNFGNDFMRATLTETNYGFAAVSAFRGRWRFEAMAMGDCLGTGLTRMMNDPFPDSDSVPNNDRRRQLAIMGDPTLRSEILLPPQNLNGQAFGSTMTLSWTAAPNTQYYVYRANNNVTGAFTRISNLLSTGGYQDNQYFSTSVVYMVRSVALTTSGSGSYTNLSQGAFYPPQ